MAKGAKPVSHLVMMLVWYGLLLIGSGGILVLGLAFGSEAYRGKPIPAEELAIILGPFLLTALFLAATLYCWTADRLRTAYHLCGVSMIGVVAAFGILGGVISI